MKAVSDELASRLLKKAVSGGGDYADIFIEHKDHVSVQLEDDRIDRVVSGVDAGIGVRVISGDRTAYAYGNDFSEPALLHLAETVSKAAGEKTDVTVDLKKSRPLTDFNIKLDPRTVGMEKKVRLVMDAGRTAKKVSRRIKQVSVSYRDSVQNVYIATSDGVIAEDERVHTVAVVHVVASDGDILQTGYEPVGGLIGFELFEKHSFEETARGVARKAVGMLDAQKISGGRMPVVISSAAGGTMIHEAVGHGLEADLARQGLSVYSGRMGQQIASGLITVIDDSTLPNRRGSFRFDDEGRPSQRTVLVEKGILKGFMYDRLTAIRDKCVSTANGRRESYESRPIPRMTNTYIAQGDSDPDEIIRSVDRGFFVRKMGGGQVNTVTGEFVFEVSEGYIVEKGRVGEPVRGATLIGNGPDVLRSIDMVGNDLGFAIGTCGKDAQGVPVSDAMPTVRIPDIVVGGKVQGG